MGLSHHPNMVSSSPRLSPSPAPSPAQGVLKGLDATRALAEVIARYLAPGFRLYLSGDLGSGKTALVRELLRSLGHRGRVASPTFALIEPYNLSRFELHHFDFYRLSHPGAWRDAGFEESFDGRAVVVVEWPEQAGGGLPTPDLHLSLAIDPQLDENARRLSITAHSELGLACLNAVLDAGFCDRVPSPHSGCAAP